MVCDLQIGRLEVVGIKPEVTYGVEAVGNFFWLPVKTKNWKLIQNFANDDQAIGIREDSTDSEITESNAEITLSNIVTDDLTGLLLSGVFGKSPTSIQQSTPNEAVYDHTFLAEQTSCLKSFTLIFQDGNQVVKILGCRVDTYDYKQERGDFLMQDIKFIGKQITDLTPPSTEVPTFVSENRFLAKHATVKIADTVANLGAANEEKLSSLSIAFSNNLAITHETASQNPSDIVATQLTTELALESSFRNVDLYNIFRNNNKRAIEINITDITKTIGNDQNPIVKFIIAKATLNDYNKDTPNDEIMKQTTAFKAHYSSTDGFAIKSEVRNLTTTY